MEPIPEPPAPAAATTRPDPPRNGTSVRLPAPEGAFTSPEVHQLLRENCAWNNGHYQAWLADTFGHSLLPQVT